MRIKKSLAYSLILSFYLSSCSSYASHSSLVFRSPTAFSSSLENEFLLNLDKLESIFIISEAVLLDFDNELNLAVLKNKKFLLDWEWHYQYYCFRQPIKTKKSYLQMFWQLHG